MVTKPHIVLTPQLMYQQFGVTDPFGQLEDATGKPIENTYMFSSLTQEVAQYLKNNPNIESVIPQINKAGVYNPLVFPHSPQYAWNEDNYGPITIPAKGTKVPLTVENLPLYKRIIKDYEHNTLEVKGNDIFINGNKATEYTFAQNYYWMMGDNRHNSEDSRFWGFVPEDHIVGKPVLIWMSLDKHQSGFKKIRWERLITTINGDGEPKSYLYYVLGALALWFLYSTFKKKKVKE